MKRKIALSLFAFLTNGVHLAAKDLNNLILNKNSIMQKLNRTQLAHHPSSLLYLKNDNYKKISYEI
jgi:hypothetical protein